MTSINSVLDMQEYLLKKVTIKHADGNGISTVTATITKFIDGLENCPPFTQTITKDLPLVCFKINEDGEYQICALMHELSMYGFAQNEGIPNLYRCDTIAVMPKGDIQAHWVSSAGSGKKKLNLHRVDGDIKRVKGIEHRIMSEADTQKATAIVQLILAVIYDTFILGKVGAELTTVEFS